MSENLYKAPEAELAVENETTGDMFYVVSKTKMAVLFISTLSMYTVYWFYINWKNYTQVTGDKTIPALRAVFYVFFTHSLLGKVQAELDKKGIEYNWSPRSLATLIVILAVVSGLIEPFATEFIGSPWGDLISLLLLPFLLILMLNAQGAINTSQDDELGATNRQFTLYNYLWVLFGIVFWILVVIGATVPDQ